MVGEWEGGLGEGRGKGEGDVRGVFFGEEKRCGMVGWGLGYENRWNFDFDLDWRRCGVWGKLHRKRRVWHYLRRYLVE